MLVCCEALDCCWSLHEQGAAKMHIASTARRCLDKGAAADEDKVCELQLCTFWSTAKKQACRLGASWISFVTNSVMRPMLHTYTHMMQGCHSQRVRCALWGSGGH